MSVDEKIFVGSKPVMSYVTAVITSMSRADNVKIMARGRAISSAVDVVELTKRNFLKEVVVDNIEIGTERLGEPGAERNVSTIAITLSRSQ